MSPYTETQLMLPVLLGDYLLEKESNEINVPSCNTSYLSHYKQ